MSVVQIIALVILFFCCMVIGVYWVRSKFFSRKYIQLEDDEIDIPVITSPSQQIDSGAKMLKKRDSGAKKDISEFKKAEFFKAEYPEYLSQYIGLDGARAARRRDIAVAPLDIAKKLREWKKENLLPQYKAQLLPDRSAEPT